MSAITIYGIKNCDTMKKAFRWLDDHDFSYDFHDYKKDGADIEVLKKAIKAHGWETVINRRGTTWRKLPDDIKETMDADKAIEIAHETPSIIKRPILLIGDKLHIGFSEESYEELLG